MSVVPATNLMVWGNEDLRALAALASFSRAANTSPPACTSISAGSSPFPRNISLAFT